MQVVYLNEKIRICLLYFSIFFMLFASNMVSAILIGEFVKYAFWAWGLFLSFFLNGRFVRTNLKILCSFLIFRCCIMLFQAFARIEVTSSTINSVIGIVLFLNTIIQTAQLCTAEEYADIYVNLLFVIAVISLICFAIQMGPLRNSILKVAHIDEGFIHNYIHLWGLDNNIWKIELFTRNAGPWWEPGAFQCFIAYAMIMIMSGRCQNNKWLRIKFLTLVATWITTQSTTGYLIMMLVFLLMFQRIMEIIFQRSYEQITGKQKVILLIVALCFVIIFFSTIGYANISEKFSEGNGSSSLRFSDIFSSLEISIENPLIGVGESLPIYYAKYGIVNNSAALLVVAMSNGWLYLIFFIMLLYRGLQGFFGKKLWFPALGAGTVILILCMTEGLVELPIIFVFFPQYREKLEI